MSLNSKNEAAFLEGMKAADVRSRLRSVAGSGYRFDISNRKKDVKLLGLYKGGGRATIPASITKDLDYEDGTPVLVANRQDVEALIRCGEFDHGVVLVYLRPLEEVAQSE
jgi:hypothetical protein